MTDKPTARKPLVAPSILSSDFGRLRHEIQAVEQAGADWIHVDVMDGLFVPNLTLGPPIIKSIRSATKLPFDVHLMIERPELSIQQYADAGADLLTVHAEACPHLHRTLSQIREAGPRPGVAINPSTPVAQIENVLHLADLLLVMTVNPGFGGQKFIAEAMTKVRDLRTLCEQRGLSPHIEVDGGITTDTIGEASSAGADVFVAGSAVFRADDYASVIAGLRDRATAQPFAH